MLVWAHHMFAVGLPWGLQAFFMISSMAVAVPTGVKIFNWLATTWRGNLIFDTPMLFALGFIAVFTMGGLSGIFLAAFPVDWQVTDTYYVVAHLHYVLFGGSIFGIFAGLYYWWPKMFGRLLDERLGKWTFWLMFVGFNVTFFPQHMLGLLGMPRRVYTYGHGGLWEWYNLTSTIGSGIMSLGILLFLVNVVRTSRIGARAGNDPWLADTLEWFTSSPPPPENFTEPVPYVTSARPLRDLRLKLKERDAVARPSLAPLAAADGDRRLRGDAARGRQRRRLARRRARADVGARAAAARAAIAVAAWLGHRRLLAPALVSIALFGAAALITTHGLHLAAAAVAFASTLVLTALVHRGETAPLGSFRDYVTLTKPRIMTLLLLTGACGMFVGAQGVPPLGDLAAMLGGLALACGGASALNHVLDRDIDSLMGERTRARPVTSGRVPASYALEFGLALSALSFVLLAGLVNVLTAALALVGNLFYVLVYTRWLKRTTPQNIVIGGAAGAVPPLVGWAAATGNLTVPALFLFLIVFFWTPPHFWALALLIKRELRGGRDPDAAGRARRARDREADPPLLVRPRRRHGRPVPLGHARPRLPRRRARARRRVHLAGRPAGTADDAEARVAPLPLLAPLPGAALRRGGHRCSHLI